MQRRVFCCDNVVSLPEKKSTTLEEQILLVLERHGALSVEEVLSFVGERGMTKDAGRDDVVEIMERLRKSGCIASAGETTAVGGVALAEPEWTLTDEGRRHRRRLLVPYLDKIEKLPHGGSMAAILGKGPAWLQEWALGRPAEPDK
jgi:hypothetical protein